MDEATGMSTFQVNLRGVVDLLAHHLYSSPRVYLRELLQNGVDAVTARAQLAESAPAGRIVLRPSSAGPRRALQVLDNGVGLTAAEMTQLLATIGASSKRDDFDFARGDFLGQFGIGLLSCFLVADEITVRSRSARTPDAQTVVWRGRSDGTYVIEPADAPLPEPGTEVTLVARPDDAGWFDPATVRELAESFGSMLPIELAIEAAASGPGGPGGQLVVSRRTPPWAAGADAGRAYCRETFGFEPLDTIALEVPVAGVRGLAFVLPTPANPSIRPQHRVYLKQMLLSQSAEGLLPDWAFFVRCVVDATELRPTASRESLYDDALLADTRDALGAQVRDWMLRLATVNPSAMARFLTVHQLGVKGIALYDDQMLRLVREHIPFETSLGDVTLAEFARTFPSIRYTRTVDDFRAVSGVAAAHGYGLINGGYTYDAALFERIAEVDRSVEVLPLDATELAGRLDPVPTGDELAARPLIRAAAAALAERDVEVVLRRFDPSSLPALYLPDPGATGRAIAQTSSAQASDLWNSVSEAVAPSAPAGRPQLVLNHGNPLIRRLIAIPPGDLTADVIGGLYVQSLLAGRHPLRASDTALLNASYLSLIERALPARDDQSGNDMQYTEDELRAQLSDAEDLPFGPARTSAVEQIVAQADAGGLDEFALEARIELINAYHEGNEPAKEFSVFGWCLAYWDAHPDSVGPWEAEMLRWQYKWVVNSLTRFPTISLDQTAAALADMKERYIRGGHSLQAVHSRWHSFARHVGDRATAEEQFRLWQAAPRDENSDCAGCDPEVRVEWLMDSGRDEDALELADAVLSGQLTCKEQPASMLEVVMLAMARLDRVDDARSAHLRSYRAQRGDRDYLQQIGGHLRFLALTGNEARGLEVLERHLGWVDTPRDPMSLMVFAAGAARLLSRLRELGHGELSVHRPPHGDRPATDPSVSELETTMTDLALALAAQFDDRNRTSAQSDRVRERLAEPPTNPVPLDAPSQRVAAPAALAAAMATALDPAGSPEPVADILGTARTAEAAEAAFDREGAAALRTALAATPRPADPLRRGLVADAEGWLAARADDVERAHSALREAAAAFAEAGDAARGAAARSRLALSLAEHVGPAAADEARAMAAAALAEAIASAGDWDDPDLGEHAVVLARQRQADVLTRTGDPAGARAALTDVQRPADVRRAAILDLSDAFAAATAGDLAAASGTARRAHGALRTAGHPQEAAGAGLLLAQCLAGAGQVAAAAEVAARAVPNLAPTPSPRRRAEAHQLLGSLLRQAGRLVEAASAYREAVADFTAAGAEADAAGTGYALAAIYRSLDRNLEAAELLEQYLPVYRAQGDEIATARTQLLLAQALSAIGEADSASAHAANATEALLAEGAWEAAADAAMFAATHSERRGNADDAARHYGQAVEAFAAWGEPVMAAQAARRQAKMTFLNNREAGRALFAAALERIDALPPGDEVQLQWERADWNDDLAWALWMADLNEEALAPCAAAEAAYLASGDVAGAGRAALFGSQLVSERGDWAAARAHAERALALFEQAGLEEWVIEAQEKLSNLPDED